MLKKFTMLAAVLVLALSTASCTAKDTTGNGTAGKDESYPQFSEMKKGEEVAVIKTNKGVIKLRFFGELAPKAVENFVTHAKDGYYDGVIFHRVIEGFMLQTGDPEGTGMGGESIWGETFGYETTPKLHHIRGAVAMAHSQAPDSNGSQFYIVQNKDIGPDYKTELQFMLDNPDTPVSEGSTEKIDDYFPAPFLESYIKDGGTIDLDFGYTVFAQVYEGLDIVDEIAAVEVKTDEAAGFDHRPVEEVIIESITIEKYK